MTEDENSETDSELNQRPFECIDFVSNFFSQHDNQRPPTITEEWVCDGCGELMLFDDVAYDGEEKCQCQGVGHSSIYELIRRKDVIEMLEDERKKLNDMGHEKCVESDRCFCERADGLLKDLKQKLKSEAGKGD